MKRHIISVYNQSGSVDQVLTNALLADFFSQNQKIQLIKAYRQVSGEGLKFSKDAIEENYTLNGLIKLFAPYLEKDLTAIKFGIAKGVECALDNFQTLGFDSPFDAVRMVVDNIEQKGL